jgi:hypothetical protein
MFNKTTHMTREHITCRHEYILCSYLNIRAYMSVTFITTLHIKAKMYFKTLLSSLCDANCIKTRQCMKVWWFFPMGHILLCILYILYKTTVLWYNLWHDNKHTGKIWMLKYNKDNHPHHIRIILRYVKYFCREIRSIQIFNKKIKEIRSIQIFLNFMKYISI